MRQAPVEREQYRMTARPFQQPQAVAQLTGRGARVGQLFGLRGLIDHVVDKAIIGGDQLLATAQLVERPLRMSAQIKKAFC
jgi:hypothetical protein